MNRTYFLRRGALLLLWLGLALLGLGGSAQAACGPGNLSDFCSANYGLLGNVSAIGSATSPTTPAVDESQLLRVGALFYTDYKALEAEARGLLERNIRFREDISPYRGINQFDDLVRKFDEGSGFSEPYTDPISGTVSLQARIDLADAQLRRARDIYSFLAIYAPVARMRADADYKNTLCAKPENPNPPDPQRAGRVLEPVLDWCDFAARLRQTVREAAYLRLIFAQQFMVDALGLHFSGGALIGGEKFVRDEIAKLRAAQYQFQLAQEELSEGLDHAIGSGCYLADLYTDAEWALLSRSAQGREQAQHHIATRLSYLDIDSLGDLPRAEAAANTTFRAATTEGYLNLVGTAGLAVTQPQGAGCALGARPSGQYVADMALDLLDTRAKARELREGRNIFGFDLAFTPARPYHTAFGSTDQGLWEQAKAAADLALQLQQQTENAERVFDLNQQDLSKALLDINASTDYDIQAAAGCDRQGFGSDAEYYACVDQMVEDTAKCDPTSNSFDACMDQTTDGQPPKPDCSNCVILVSTMRQTRQDLRVAWLGVEAAIQKRDNIFKRKELEEVRNVRVTNVTYTNAKEMAAFDAALAAANCCPVTFGTDNSATINPALPVVILLESMKTLVEAANEVKVEDANSEAVVKNLLLDIAEAQSEIASAVQQYNSKLTDYNGVVGQLLHDVTESQRQRAYTLALPANDPSYRMVRDSRRLELAAQLELAARQAYLAARRGEYEYTARLSASNFRISDIYKARTANDILIFLQGLEGAIANLPGSIKDAETNQRDLTISVAQHVLGLSDAYLRGRGVADANLQTERTRRFRQWVARNTRIGSDGKPTLVFTFTTSIASKGLIGQVVQQGYDFYWLHKLAGIGQPKPANNGFGVNLVSAQAGTLGYRQVRVSQSGQVALTSFAGCLFDYRLIPPAVLLGLDYPETQPTEVVTGIFNADINNTHANSTPGYSTPAFLGRPLASNGWQVVVYAGSPDGILPDLNLQQLTDIELKISTTYATRPTNTPPAPSACVRIDF